ncbi:MAG TPA: segregation/condensation protein A [Candidatus Paceibacterota bacterium]
MSFAIKTEKFEGPIELLLDLMEKRKLHPSDVSLAMVADDYINYVQNSGVLPVDETANFLLVASTLLLIKSRSLLPNLSLSEEETISIADLEERLRIYQDIRNKAKTLSAMYGDDVLYATQNTREVEVVFAPSKDATLEGLISGIKSVIDKFPKKEILPRVVVQKIISLEETITKLAERVSQHLKMSFREFSGKLGGEKVSIIVSFLAMLELVKQGVIGVTQHSHFSDIEMETEEANKIPKYL